MYMSAHALKALSCLSAFSPVHTTDVSACDTVHGAPASVPYCSTRMLLQEEVKQQIRIKADTHYRGYQRLGANVTRYEEGYQRDWHEAIDFYREQSPHVSASLD